MKKIINNNTILDKNIKILKVIIIACFFVISIRLIYLNIYMKKYYNMLLNTYEKKYIEIESAPRGRIYDRNYNLLVDNVAVKSIIYNKGNNTKEES